MSPEERYAALVEELAGEPGVNAPSGGGRPRFGADALKVDGRVFAMLSRGRLVVKLPAARVDALVAAGAGDRFDAGRARPMKEWLALRPAAPSDWPSLAREALRFVRAGR